MSPDEFREAAGRIADWVASYMERVEEFPVMSRARPGEVFSSLPEAPPEGPEPLDAVMADLEKLILPGLTHWQSPSFFGYFPANATGPAMLADMVASGLGVQGMLWSTSPACTEVETRVLDWLAGMLGLPERFDSRTGIGGGVIQGTASEATLVALVAARARALRNDPDVDHSAPFGVYTSTQAHSSIVKGASIAGLGADAVRLIEVDERLAMRPDALAEAIARDRAAGRRPLFVCATVGTTSSAAIDPVRPIGELCRRENLWLHVDAAYAGAMCVCPEYRWIIDGVEHADSFVFNPHKWLLTNFDCSAFWVADRADLLGALSITPEYLRNAASDAGAVIDYRDWQIPLGRRFRSLKLWFVIRHYGVEGLREFIRHHLGLAELFESLVRSDERFEICAPRTTSLVCFRLRAGDEPSRELLRRLNESGAMFLTHTTLPDPGAPGVDRYTLRMAIGAVRTQEQHIRAAWRRMQETATEVLAG
ncbi:MAG: aspartate aminotransferase family protein [Phycisphaeraceae bacterium]|nr:MAG: aspartate aminotransferase family protein [Phycisphaeraceae bacterium]